MMPFRFPAQGFFNRVWRVRISRADSGQQFAALLAVDKVFQRQHEQTTARDFHLAGEVFRLFE